MFASFLMVLDGEGIILRHRRRDKVVIGKGGV
jgi:hypothetical protein